MESVSRTPAPNNPTIKADREIRFLPRWGNPTGDPPDFTGSKKALSIDASYQARGTCAREIVGTSKGSPSGATTRTKAAGWLGGGAESR